MYEWHFLLGLLNAKDDSMSDFTYKILYLKKKIHTYTMDEMLFPPWGLYKLLLIENIYIYMKNNIIFRWGNIEHLRIIMERHIDIIFMINV